MAMEAYGRLLVQEVRLGLEIVENVPEVLGSVHCRVDKRDAHLSVRERQVPEPVHLFDRQLLARPFHDGGGGGVEVVKVLARRHVVVVVAHDNRAAECPHYLHALVRTGVVANHVAGAEKIRHALGATVVKDHVERVQVGVYVAEYGKQL